MNVKLARNSIGDGGRQLFYCLRLNAGLGFLYKSDIGFVYVYDKILGLVRKQILDNIVNRNVMRLYSPYKYNGA